MTRNSFLSTLFATSIAFMNCALSVAQTTFVKGTYSIIEAKKSDKSHEYLTVESVMNQLNSDLKKLLPDPANAQLILLDVTFKTDGDPSKGNELNPTDMEVQWAVKDVEGKAPVIGVHLSKDFIITGSGSGFFTSMRPDTYEVFCIVPNGVKQINLAQRVPDGAYKVVKSDIALESTKKP
ncbi:hypothetical protein L0156_28090 [bacterium]|nr:hypothetical protein [bacterium]